MSSGVLQVFCRCSGRLRACWTGPRAWYGGLGPWSALFPDSCRSRVSGRAGSRTGRSPAGEAGAARRP